MKQDVITRPQWVNGMLNMIQSHQLLYPYNICNVCMRRCHHCRACPVRYRPGPLMWQGRVVYGKDSQKISHVVLLMPQLFVQQLFFQTKTKKSSKFRITGTMSRGIYWPPGDSPHQGSVMQKVSMSWSDHVYRFLPLALSGRRGIVIARVCPSVRLSFTLSAR